MRHLAYLVVACALLVLAAGCVRSVRAVFPESEGVDLLPANAVLVTDDKSGVYKVARSGGGYAFDPAYAGDYRSALFAKLDGNGNYIIQALTEKEGYRYALAQKENGVLNVFTFKAGELTDKERLSITKLLDDGSVQIEDRTAMIAFHTAGLRHLTEATKVSYKILDYDNPHEQALANEALKFADAKNAKKSGEQQSANAAKPVPSSSGAWSLVQETDPMTDAKLTRIVGKPTSFVGTQDQPLMQVSCGPSGVAFAVYWGAQMEDLYPEGEADFVAVDVRFDKSEPARLGWAASKDWGTTYNPNELAAGLGQIAQSMMEALLPTQKVALAWDKAGFHRAMKNASRLILRGSTRSGNWAVLEFDMSGYSDLARALPSQCG